MKRTKSLSVLIMSLLLVLSLALGFAFLRPEHRVSALSGSQYVTYVDSIHQPNDIKLENDKVVIPMKGGDSAKLATKVIIDEFGIKFNMPENATKLTFTVTADSYIATGNPLVNGTETTYETEIKNQIVFEVEGANLNTAFNDGTLVSLPYTADMDLSVSLSLADNLLNASVNGSALNYTATDYYKLATVNGKVKANISFEVETLETFTEDVNFALEYVDQNTLTAGEHKQTFVLNTEGTALETVAKSRILFNQSFFAGNVPAGFDNVVLDGKNYTVSVENYSITGENPLSNIELVASEDFVYVGDISDTQKLINFNIATASANATLSFVDKDDATIVYDTFEIQAVQEDETAPVYNASSVAMESFENALLKATKSEYEIGGETKEYSIRLGDGQYLELPSMKSLVGDNLTSYENLKYNVYYSNITETSTNGSALKIPVNVAGDYFFYVVFTDEEGNAMKTKDFYEIEEDTKVPGIYGDYVFTFTLADDAPMLITAASQGSGYKGVVYTAASFDITASGYTAEYTLYYSATALDKNAEGWQRIYSLKEISDGAESQDFTKEELEEIAYDGKYTFTPVEKGYYKLVCKVNSSNSERSVSESSIIEVNDEPTYVKPDSKWLQNNLWSVIFLSVGTLCLIGIIILLCIKPKTEDGEKEVKTIKVRSKKNK